MARSYVSLNAEPFKRRVRTYFARMSTASVEALEMGKQAILAHAIACSPSPAEEERVFLSYEITGEVMHPKKADTLREANRNRFFKDAGREQFYIRELLINPDMQNLLFIPRFDLKQNVGFYVGPTVLLDQFTKFSWTNVSQQGRVPVQFTNVSKNGTFLAFEYGWTYTIKPRHQPEGKGKTYVSPAPGVYATEVVKRVPAMPMFSNIIPQQIVGVMKEVLSQVRFKE